jgi:hypothetical protein
MKPIDDAVGKHWLEQQLYTMEAQKRLLLGGDAGSKNALGLAYDAGYLACLSELRAIIFNPTPEQKRERADDDNIFDDEYFTESEDA